MKLPAGDNFMAIFTSMLKFLKSLLGFTSEKEVEDPMKYLIVGLGNIGPDYVGTRHNIGFEVVDYIARELDASFEIQTLGALASCKFKGRQLFLLKPSTYMNLSGKAVRYWMQKKKVKLQNVLIVLDDLNLPYGKIRLRKKGSDGGHNGLRNIQQVLATNQYARLRIGIGDDFNKGRQVDYVLGQWTPKELESLPEILHNSLEAVQAFSTIGVDRAMNLYN